MSKMKDNSVDLIVTDPPYNFQVNGGGLYNQKKLMRDIKNIKTNEFDFNGYIPQLLDLQKGGVNAYFFCNKSLIPNYLKEAQERNLNFDILALRKKNPIPSKKSSYVPELEYVIFLRDEGVFFNGSLSLKYYKKIFSVVIGHSNLLHPNQKPKEFIKRFILISSKEGDIILDPFCGSGTTALACKETNRNFICFDNNQHYVNIANERLTQTNLTTIMQKTLHNNKRQDTNLAQKT